MHGLSLGIPGVGPVDPGTHFCALHSGPAERDQLLFPFLDEGLRHGDKVWCLVDDVQPSVVRARAVGPRGPRSRDSGRLDVERATDVYLRAGEFDVDAMAQGLVEGVDAAVATGLEVFRAVGEMSWVLDRARACEDLRLHESVLDRVVQHAPAIVMCLYDLTRFGADMLVDVLRTHTTVLLDGSMVDNPYYVGPTDDATSARDAPAARQPLVTTGDGSRDGWGSLTCAELRIAAHVSRGATNRAIAAELQVSRHTVDAHVKHIYLKLQIHSRVELTVLVLRQRLGLD